MTLAGVLLVTVVVWAISAIRSVRLRAFVYSLPLPVTLALVTTGSRVDGGQVLGVVGLVLFFLTVGWLHRRWRWPILLADAAGIGVYVALAAAVQAAGPVPFRPALAGVLAAWAVTMLVLRRRPAPEPAAAAPGGLPPLARPFVIFAGAAVTALLGQALRGMVVTFPYAGVLTAVETRRDLLVFTRHFARNSVALVAFVAGYHQFQHGPQPVALLAGWAAFGVTALALHGPGWLPARRLGGGPASTGSDNRGPVLPTTHSDPGHLGQRSTVVRPVQPVDAVPDGPPDPVDRTGLVDHRPQHGV
jgi:hypothetical protein